jgi:hypothetical protein
MPSITPGNKHRSVSHTGAITMNCGDVVAKAFAGISSNTFSVAASAMGVDMTKYDTLNPGHRRMVVGQRIRRLVRERDAAAAKFDGVSSGEEWLRDEVAKAIAITGESRADQSPVAAAA